ncbi:MAG: hypothetical protein HDS66_05865 [Bacteroidales bacterium]|nr:hypothetical protein [Bacteroidales bacterium]
MFRNALEDCQYQYNEKLRMETIEYDPLVTHYLEKWAQNVSQENRSQQVKNNTTVTHAGSKTRTYGGSDSTNATYGDLTKESGTDTRKLTGSDKRELTYNSGDTLESSRNNEVSGERQSSGKKVDSEDRADSSRNQDLKQANEQGRTYALRRGLAGALPQSETYGASVQADAVKPTLPDLPGAQLPELKLPESGDITLEDYNMTQQAFPATPQPVISPPPNEMPDKLDWTYASSQEEGDSDSWTGGNRIDAGDSVSASRGQTSASSESADTEKSVGTEVGHSVESRNKSGNDTDELTYGKIDKLEKGTQIESGGSSSRNVTYGKTVTDSMADMSDHTEGGSTTYGGKSAGLTSVERVTGRDGIAPDILARAQVYIGKTNAFRWLCSYLDSCFALVWDVR